MASYTSSCVLRMSSKRDAEELLRGKHRILGFEAVVQPYKGYAAHEEELSKGIFKLRVSDLMDYQDDDVNYKQVVEVFHEFGCTNIKLLKDRHGTLRYVAVRFKTKEDRASAIKEMEELKLGWKIRNRKGKKEKAKERENNI